MNHHLRGAAGRRGPQGAAGGRRASFGTWDMTAFVSMRLQRLHASQGQGPFFLHHEMRLAPAIAWIAR